MPTTQPINEARTTDRLNHVAAPVAAVDVVAIHALEDAPIAADTPADAYQVELTDGTTEIVVPGHRCSCGEYDPFQPSMGTPAQTAQRKRRHAECPHATAVNNAERLGECDCGAWGITITPHRDSVGNVVLEETTCAECGSRRGGI